jgi:hypothetical protein
MECVITGDIVGAQNALSLGADVHTGYENALRNAALYEYADIVELLCNHGANCRNALIYAAEIGDVTTTANLLKLVPPAKIQLVSRTLCAAFKRNGKRKAATSSTKPKQPLDWVDRLNKINGSRKRFIA